ncbi:hypothetical protein [Streptomyces reniochalinae]|uniref:DUF3558 domain-containing protein n=1 Tax=Streptomyces reniochalinae TaxID=2250578 RepID=A0A367E785_9ACTN|nr:hypothetical protein [Streptomyces reniochalinae]RCG13257.1 hypothetical protein DQ392_33685 [Streptomyces reniochalinae]
MNHRRRNLLLAITLAVVILAVGGGWATGTFTDWRDRLSMRDACDGVLVGDDDIRDTLGGERVFAEDVQQDSETRDGLTHCLVRGSDQTQPALRVDVRWSEDAHKEALPQGHADTWQETGTAAPIGKGWPGTVSAVGGDFHATVALACPDGKKAEGKSSLLVTADLGRDAQHNDSHVRTSLARFTTGTAAKAADKYGCPTPQQHRPEKVAQAPLDKSVPLTEARGSCSAVRDLSRKEQHRGITRAQETPADNDAPLLDCFLSTSEGKPGYRLSATFGPYAKSYQQAAGSSPIHGEFGFDKEEHSYAWATADCPGSPQRALFTAWSVLNDRTNKPTVANPSPAFVRNALAAYAKTTADARGCTDLQLPH